MSGVNIPENYTITLKDADFLDVRLSGGSDALTTCLTGDANKPIATCLTGDAAKPIATLLIGDKDKPLTTLLTGDTTKPIATQITGDKDKPIATTFELLNIPRLTLADIKDLLTPKLRLRMPNYEQVCLKLFGVEVLSLCLSGELQTIIEGYRPNRFERCDIDCCELDERPFPDKTGTHRDVEP